MALPATASPCQWLGSSACGRTKSGPIVQAARAVHRVAATKVRNTLPALMRPPRPCGPARAARSARARGCPGQRGLPPTCRRAAAPAVAGPAPARSSPECAAPPW
ncbi:hypothetical protein G6F22_020760 [Rhizopus arrhizus]|nr:hypothetical protein G6F22_020760 [Rhizopus arrhizus]